MIGGGLSTRLRTAARCFTHWEHAQYILEEDVGLSGDPARLCYSALLKTLHGPDDPRNLQALFRGRGLVRVDGCWATADLSRTHRDGGLSKRLGALPAVQYLHTDDHGKTEALIDPERLGIFEGVDDLAPYGYPRVQVVRGLKIFWHWRDNPDPHVVRAVVPPEKLRAPEMQAYRPRYVPDARRMPLPEAEAFLEASFPGISWPYLRLLIAARGCAESGLGQPPRLAVDGPSGAGKDATIKVAAMLIGDQHQDVPWNEDVREFHLGLHEASQNAGLVSSGEIIKLIRAKKRDVLASLSALLTYDCGITIRRLYTGPTPVRQVPALVITDTSFPPELHCDEQMGRRFVYVHLQRKVDWQRTAELGIDGWRARSPDHAAAANALVSQVIDEFFSQPSPLVFEDIARELGFGLLNQSQDTGLDPREDLLALFRACLSPEAVAAPDATWKGRAWKLIRREAKDPLSLAWQAVCDNPGEGFTTSRRVKEADWGRLLGVGEAVECDLSPKGGSTLAIRFRCGKARSEYARYNQEIRPPDAPPDPPSAPPDQPPDAPPPPPPPAPPSPAPGSPARTCDQAPPAAPEPNRPEAPEPPDTLVRDVTVSTTAPPSLPIFVDLETRSLCDLKDVGGQRYARHPSTEILALAALIDGQVIVWTPTLPRPVAGDTLWPAGHGPAHPVATFAGPDLPPPLAEAIAAGRQLCAQRLRF